MRRLKDGMRRLKDGMQKMSAASILGYVVVGLSYPWVIFVWEVTKPLVFD